MNRNICNIFGKKLGC